MPLTGKTLADGYVELRIDDSKLDAETRSKVSKVTNVFGSRLNKELQALDVEPIDIKASPRDALAAVDRVQDKLRELSRNAETVEVRVKTESALTQLSTFRKKLGSVGPEAGPEAATGFAAKFTQRLGPLVASMPLAGPMGTALVGAGVAAAPLLGAIISAAVIGGAGIGGVIGGLAIAAKDARVQESAKTLAREFEERLENAGGAFVEPALDGLETVDDALDSIDIARIFKDASKYVDPLARGLGSAVTSLGDAIETLVANAGPVIDVIGSGIAEIGKVLGDGLTSLADNGEDAAVAIDTLVGLISSSISVTLTAVNALTELYGIAHKFGFDLGLQTFLKLSRIEMDKNSFSARRVAEGTDAMGGGMILAADAAKQLKKDQELLTAVQNKAKLAQDALGRTLDSLGGKTTFAARTSDALKTAMDNLYGATIRQSDANEGYESSWDGLSASVKANKQSLDVHTESGRANRSALRALIGSTNEAYLADINAGVAIDKARQKHENRIKAIKEESAKLGLNKEATQNMINTYGKIPPKKTTELILSGISRVADALLDLAAVQIHLAKGTPLSADLARRLARAQYGMPDTKRAFGGPLPGRAPHDRADNMVYRGTPGEWVIQKPTVRQVERQHGAGAMAYFNRYGELPAFAKGGSLPERWPRTVQFDTNVLKTRVPSLAEAISKVAISFGGGWPSSPSAQRGDSGVWRKVVALIRSTGPLSGSFGNGYRPGDPKWHGSGRAVDWMGFNQDALATVLASRRPLELIHRTNRRDYAYTRGVNKGSFNNALMEAHRNHVHIAMARGGKLPSLIPFGAYDTGGTLPTGLSLAYNGTGRPEPVGHGLGEVHIHIHDSVIASKRQAVELVTEAYNQAKYERKIA